MNKKCVKMTILCFGVIIFFVSLCDYSFSIEQGRAPNMVDIENISTDVWKGIVPISFKGRIIDSQTGEAIKVFSVCEIINGLPLSGQIESKSQIIDLGSQIIKTIDGHYKFILHISTLDGRIYVQNDRRVRVLGKTPGFITIQIMAQGYDNKIIKIAKDEIIVDEDNSKDIFLDPIR